MSNEIEQGLHEKLCAYILGEASEAARAEVERALEASPELRAERERIEGTIGLVKGAMAGSESLPRSADEILTEARTPWVRPWYSRASFRAAAGIAAAALVGAIGYRSMQSEPGTLGIDFAKMDRGMNQRGRALVKNEEPLAKPQPAASELLAFDEAQKRTERKDEAPAEVVDRSSALASGESAPASGIGVGGSRPTLTVESLEVIDRAADQVNFGVPESAAEDERAKLLARLGYVGRDNMESTPVAPDPPRADSGLLAGYTRTSPESQANPAAGRAPLAGGRPSGPATGGPSAPAAREPAGGYRYPYQAPATLDGAEESKDGRVALRSEVLGETLHGLGYIGDDKDDFFLGARVSQLSPEDRERWIEEECHRVVRICRRRPNERPRDMFFRFWGDNPFELSAIDSLSTFSVDVDTASYALARRYLNEGLIPEKAQIRTEEFVNYFQADVPAPTEGTFAIHTDLAPSRFSSDKARSMLRVVVRGREVAKEERKPLHITFVIDTSGSMKEQNRLELVKHAMRLLVNELGANDAISIVAFASDARMILPMTSAGQKALIESAIFPLSPDGSTNAAAGLVMGYTEAMTKISPNANNRVVLLSDGVANTGETEQSRMSDSVKLHREKGIYLNTIGVGMNNHNDALLEQLADKGDGVCAYVDTPEEARKAIVDRFTGAFETIARDVKVQVEFDPAQVERYRLLGYENRAVADQDFRNDAIDAGEVGAGHQVTALYEIERAAGVSEKPLATVRLRWKAPRNLHAPGANEEANEIAKPVLSTQQTGFEGAGVGYRRAAIVAQFAEFLRRSVHARGDSLDDLIVQADNLSKETQDPETLELVVLLHKSKQLILNALPRCDDLCQTIDAVRRNSMLRCETELLAKESSGRILEEIERENTRLEERIRELLRRKLEEQPK